MNDTERIGIIMTVAQIIVSIVYFIVSLALVVALHLWKRRTLISIAAGTVFYMLLVQLVF